jgi:hypothetical protein
LRDLGYHFLQLSLIIGAISLMMRDTKIKNILCWVLVSLGAVGICLSVYAFILARSVG